MVRWGSHAIAPSEVRVGSATGVAGFGERIFGKALAVPAI